MPILLFGLDSSAPPPLPPAPLGIPPTAFWMYVSATVALVVGLIAIVPELRRLHGSDRLMPLGRLFFAVPMAVFASEHFTLTKNIAALIPRWIPAHAAWTYLVGAAFFCAALSLASRVQARLAAALLAATFFLFVLVMDLPAAVANPGNRFFWALAFRETAFGAGALAFAVSAWRARTGPAGPARPWTAIPRILVAVAALYYGVESLLHPAFVPGIPLRQLAPGWIYGHVFVTVFVGVVLLLAGVALLVNRKTHLAATILGLTLLLALVWVYLPMLLAAPTDVVALNYFFDTLLFCGAVLLLAGALDHETAVGELATTSPELTSRVPA